eukprot:5199256-Prymnesium_polylepis.1
MTLSRCSFSQNSGAAGYVPFEAFRRVVNACVSLMSTHGEPANGASAAAPPLPAATPMDAVEWI